MKKTVAAFLAGAMALYSLSIPAFAAGSSSTYGAVLPGGGSVHGGEVFRGSYANENNKNLVLLIMPSAQTSLLTTSVYNSATTWNNKSSNVSVYVYFNSLPSSYNYNIIFMPVTGKVLDGGVAGQTNPHDKNGNAASLNSDWVYVDIEMNTSVSVYSAASDITTTAKKVFMHEVGHALKLAHPTNSSSITGHNHSGYPYAIMNQGIPSSAGGKSHVSATPAWHDKECLTYKWGD